MNAAILLVASAWMTGQAPEVIIQVQHHGPAASSCGNSCGSSCCDDAGVGHRLRGRLQGLFQRDSCCEPQCAPANQCCESRGHRFSFSFGHRRNNDCCEPACPTTCDPCCGGPNLLERIRSRFHRDRGCCEDACCGGTSTMGGGAAPSAEPLKDQPKKMPSKDGAKEVRIITPPNQAPIAPAIQNAPVINNTTPAVAPAVTPRIIESGVRNPF